MGGLQLFQEHGACFNIEALVSISLLYNQLQTRCGNFRWVTVSLFKRYTLPDNI